MCDQGDISIVRTAAIRTEMELVQREIINIKEQLVFVKHTYEFMHKTLHELEENNLQSRNDLINNESNIFSKNIEFEKDDDISTDDERSSDCDYKDEFTVKDVYQRKRKMSLLSDERKPKHRKYQISQPGDLFLERNMAVIKPTPPSLIDEPSSSDNEYSYGYSCKKKRVRKCKDDIENTAHIPIGLGNTMIPKDVYDKINWNSYTVATRKLLMAVFSRKVLATHSLTGKPSPAFLNKPAKQILNPLNVADIVFEVTEKCNVKPNLVRIAITTKCADENKMMRTRTMERNAF